MLFFLTVILLGGFTYIAWRSTAEALVLLLFCLPLYLFRFSVGPLPLTLLELLLFITIGLWIVKGEFREIPLYALKKWKWPLALIAAASVVSIFVAQDTLSALGIWKAYYAEPAIVGLLMLSTWKTRADWKEGLYALLFGAGVYALYGCVQALTGIGIPEPWSIEHRATSVFPYPNALGLYLAPLTSAGVVLSIAHRSWKLALLSVLGVLGIIASQTEAALVAIPAALTIALFFFVSDKRSKWLTAIVGIVVLGAALALPITRSKLFLQDYSGGVRRAQWSETVDLLRDHQLFGVGLNGYPDALTAYHDDTIYEIFQYPHNLLLNGWSETGLVGLVGIVWLICALGIALHNQKEPLAVSAFAALLTMIIHGFVDVPFYKNDLAILTMFFLALTVYLTARFETLNTLQTAPSPSRAPKELRPSEEVAKADRLKRIPKGLERPLQKWRARFAAGQKR